MEIGDAVLANDSKLRILHVGIVQSSYLYAPDTEFGHRRKVEWVAQVSRDKLSPESLRKLQTPTTLFQVDIEAWREIQATATATPES